MVYTDYIEKWTEALDSLLSVQLLADIFFCNSALITCPLQDWVEYIYDGQTKTVSLSKWLQGNPLPFRAKAFLL